MSVNPLPDAWIDKIFSHMSSMYGSKFADLWRDTDLKAVKALWAEKLGGFLDQPSAIKSALDALDDKPWPPTLPEFLMLCREAAKRTSTGRPALPPPDLTPEQIQANLDRLHAITGSMFKPIPRGE